MELKSFVSLSLEQICYGIKEARDKVMKDLNNCPIAPSTVAGEPSHREREILFDISVTVVNDSSLQATGKIGVVAVSGQAQVEGKSSTEGVHRISFSVPFYPEFLWDPRNIEQSEGEDSRNASRETDSVSF